MRDRENLLNVLCWRSPELGLKLAHQIRMRRIGHAVELFWRLPELSRPYERRLMEEKIEALSFEQKLRIFDSPHLIQYLREGSTEDAYELITDALAIELFGKEKNETTDTEMWDSLGEQRLVSSKVERVSPSFLGVIVDCQSRYHARSLTNRRGRKVIREAAYQEDTGELVNKIGNAISGILKTDPECMLFVQSNINVIMPRIDLNENLFKGSSNANSVGLMNIYNAHLDYITDHNIASSIIHESIHSFLFEIERERPFVSGDIDLADSLESPWSGTRLDLTTYLHACFVWFALAMFWSNEQAIKHFEIGGIHRQLSKAIAGFLKQDQFGKIEQFRNRIEEPILDQVLKMPDQIRQLADR